MAFKKISLNEIRPFIRCAIDTGQLIHTAYVAALEHRIFFIEEGFGTFWVANECYKFEKNDIFYVSSNTPYKMESDKDARVLVIYFDLTMKNSSYHKRILPRDVNGERNLLCEYKLTSENDDVVFLFSNNNPNVFKWINRIKRYLEGDYISEANKNILSGLMIVLLSEILENQNMAIKRKSYLNVAGAIAEYIHKNYAEKITLEDIEEELNFHRNYLNRCFKKHTGVSIYNYLLNYRLEQAMNFLMYTDASVSEVAENVGFKNSKSFSTAFKKLYSVTPSSLSGVKYKK